MKIAITPNQEAGSTDAPQPRVLGDDALREFIELLMPIDAGIEVQIVALPRAKTTERFERGNQSIRFGWVTHREHQSMAAATAFAMQEIKDVLGLVGTLSILGSGVSGGGEQTITNCIISSVRIVDLSSSTSIQYTVEGGAFD